jgi:hypothetical protein
VQKKEKNIDKIKHLLAETGLRWTEHQKKDGTYVWKFHNKEVHSYFSQFGASSEKWIPKEFLSWNKETLQIMLDWLLLGDGKNRKAKSGRLIIEYATTSYTLANNVSEIVFKLGYGSFIKEQKHVDHKINGVDCLAKNCKPLWISCANISKTSFQKDDVKINFVDYDGFVYCVRVANKNWLMRRNHKVAWTSNCDHEDQAEVSLKTASHVLDDIWWKDGEDNSKQLFGKIRLLNTPMGQIAKEIVLSGIPLGISSRAVGSVEKDHKMGADVVQPDFHLITYDIVATPSNAGSFLKLSENKQINFNPDKVLPAKFRVKETLAELLKK